MIIQVLDQKYKCGCGKGMAKLEKPSLLSKLNLIIEWDLCTFPPKKENELTKSKEKTIFEDELDENGQPTGKQVEKTVPEIEEDRDYLGDPPELRPGNCFLFKGQVIAVENENTLVLVVSETGYLALNRIWEETIVPELDFLYNGERIDESDGINSELVDKKVLPDNFESKNLKYAYWRIWKDRSEKEIEEIKKDKLLKCELTSDDYIYPVTIYLDEWKMYYNPEELDEDMVEEAGMKALFLLIT